MERERTGVGYTVHELAELSGCTVRTLHHYDDLGLVPAQRANNGYRRYGAAEVDRLHQLVRRHARTRARTVRPCARVGRGVQPRACGRRP